MKFLLYCCHIKKLFVIEAHWQEVVFWKTNYNKKRNIHLPLSVVKKLRRQKKWAKGKMNKNNALKWIQFNWIWVVPLGSKYLVWIKKDQNFLFVFVIVIVIGCHKIQINNDWAKGLEIQQTREQNYSELIKL